MNLFETFFPLVLLLVAALVGGWVLPLRRAPKNLYDIDAVLEHHRQALNDAREASIEALRVAREANRELKSANRRLEEIADLRARSKAS